MPHWRNADRHPPAADVPPKAAISRMGVHHYERLLVLSNPCSFSRTSRSFTHSLTKKVARDVEQSETPLIRWGGILGRLDVDLDELFTRVHFDPYRRVAKIDFVASAIVSTDYRMGHVVPLSSCLDSL